ncbi:MAG: histidine kinase dimerization/phospho-acceptor domain-containing protein, partial [Anaerolineales bacterium]
MLPDFRVRQRDYLLEIGRAITQELNLDELLARILHISAEMLAGQSGLILLREEGKGWDVVASHGIPSTFLQYIEPFLQTIPDDDDPSQFELQKINLLIQQVIRTASLGLLGGVGLPLVFHGHVIGMIHIFRNYSARFSANDQALLQSFADQAAIAVRNAQLYTQLRREKQRLDTLLDSVADGILILGPDHKIEHCNPAFVRLFGVPANQISGKDHEEIIQLKRLAHGTTLEKAESGAWPLTPNATLYVEGDLNRLNKPPIPVGITYAPILTSEGTLTNIIATVRDITHFREADELKSTFISIISHELKTPVALIKGYSGTLRREDVKWDWEVVQDSLAVIEEEADRLTDLIENLLDATRLQTGTLTLSKSDLYLPTKSDAMAKRFQIQTNNHQIVVDFPPNFPVIEADEDRIDQVLFNLLSNSIKYSPQGGEIRISGHIRPEQVVV